MTMTMTLPLALLAAFGTFLAVDALRPRRPRVKLLAEDNRPALQRWQDTLFTPAAERVLAVRRLDAARVKADLEVRLKRANYPAPFLTPDAVLSYRLFTAVLFAVFGGIFGLVIGLGGGVLLMMAGLAAFGWSTPDNTLRNAERARQEQLLLDAASTFDRLAIHVASGSALPMAIREVAERPGGGWVAELRKLARYYAGEGNFALAADKVMNDSGRLPEIVRVLERLKAAEEMGGGGLSKALRQMAIDARITARQVIAERGYKNAVLMVLPAFFAILAIMIILVAPGAVQMISALGAG